VQEEEGTKRGDRGLSGPPIRFSLADLRGRVAGARATARADKGVDGAGGEPGVSWSTDRGRAGVPVNFT
jgi:hypothetical protein